jgi:hypothetical protein
MPTWDTFLMMGHHPPENAIVLIRQLSDSLKNKTLYQFSLGKPNYEPTAKANE